MARRSNPHAPMPPRGPIVDDNQAMAMLSYMHHWVARKLNPTKGRTYPGVLVEITSHGKRLDARARTFPAATAAVLAKLRALKAPPPLEIYRPWEDGSDEHE